MLEKEMHDALKRFVESLVALLIMPITYAWDRLVTKMGLDFPSLIRTGFVVTLIVYAVYAGATVFQSERKDRAFEYLFSLPVSRRRIMLAKILPRLVLLVLLGGAATAVLGRGVPLELGVTVLVLFCASLFLSIGVFSLVIGGFGVALLYGLYLSGSRAAAYLLMKLRIVREITGTGALAPQLTSAAVLLVPFGIAFWLTFKKMDARPLKLQMRTYYAIVLPTLVIAIALLVVFFQTVRMGGQGG